MIYLLAIACTREIPDAYTAAFEACSGLEEPTDECLEHIAEDIGDQELKMAEVVFCVLPHDPYFYDLIADKIDDVVYDIGGMGSDAEYVHASNTLIVRSERVAPGIIGASVVVHEAAHALPRARDHVLCPFDGTIQCDDHDGASVGTQLDFLIESASTDDEVFFMEATERRLLAR